jgi:NADH-quinone oxidoreductase subunit J
VAVALVVVVELYYVLWVRRAGVDVTGGAAPLPEGYSNTEAVGAVLYTDYVYPFQLAAVVLLIAIVAAIALTMRRRTGLKTQDVSRQVAVRRKDRIRLVKVEPEGEP